MAKGVEYFICSLCGKKRQHPADPDGPESITMTSAAWLGLRKWASEFVVETLPEDSWNAVDFLTWAYPHVKLVASK